jgi:hypothetical protein
MRKTFTAIVAGLVLLSFGCGQKTYEETQQQDIVADTTNSNSNYTSTSSRNNYPNKNFIRTAELRFKTKDVLHTSNDIEYIVARHKGFVTYSKVNNEVQQVTSSNLGDDSTLEITKHTLSNNIILKVPSQELDSTLREITKHVEVLDYKLTQANDVSIEQNANNLISKHAAKQSTIDSAIISNQHLSKQTSYSTVELTIYQEPTIKKTVVINHYTSKEYEPTFGAKFLEALGFGLSIFQGLILFLAKLWWLIILWTIAYIGYRKNIFNIKKLLNSNR